LQISDLANWLYFRDDGEYMELGARSLMNRASDYGSEGWKLEWLQHKLQRTIVETNGNPIQRRIGKTVKESVELVRNPSSCVS
jgi:hypothetical protein